MTDIINIKMRSCPHQKLIKTFQNLAWKENKRRKKLFHHQEITVVGDKHKFTSEKKKNKNKTLFFAVLVPWGRAKGWQQWLRSLK